MRMCPQSQVIISPHTCDVRLTSSLAGGWKTNPVHLGLSCSMRTAELIYTGPF